MLYRTPKILQSFYPTLTWEKPQFEKTVFLTFDDGPIPEVTEFVLEQLDAFEIKATFFCIGDNVQKNPEILKKIIESKHRIGNHTFNHLKGWNTDGNIYIKNIEKCQKELSKLSPSVSTKLFRPPFGRIKKSQIPLVKELGFDIVMWTTLSQDYRVDVSSEKCLKATLNATRNGSIVVFHDSLKARKNLEHVLPRYIESLLEDGYTFQVL
jgi:peptidoglycan/xylan/chitin deacetylase (PgdA/CDA1 family)